MKTKQFKLILSTGVIYIAMMILLSACKKDKGTTTFGIDPESQANMTNIALNMDGKLIEGKMPESSTGNGSIAILNHPSVIQATAGVDLFIPIEVSDTICFIYLQVEGAKSYWQVKPEVNYATKLATLKIFVPNCVRNGNFNFKYAVGDCKGNISATVSTATQVSPPIGCGSDISGAYGITISHFDLGDKPGTVIVEYNMISIPDRIDLRYGNKWIASSGTLLNNSEGPNYNLDGFVSNTGTFSIAYNPANGRDLFVYVTGKDQSTAWDVTVHCAQ